MSSLGRDGPEKTPLWALIGVVADPIADQLRAEGLIEGVSLVVLLIGPDFKRGEAAVRRFVEDDAAEGPAEAEPAGGRMHVDPNDFGAGAGNAEVRLGLDEGCGLSGHERMGMQPASSHDLSFVFCDPESVGIGIRQTVKIGVVGLGFPGEAVFEERQADGLDE